MGLILGDSEVVTERRGSTLLITLNRPEAMNAINGAMATALVAAVAELDADPDLASGVLTGAGRGFCSGMDLKAFAAGEDVGPMDEFFRYGATKPLIAAIEGFALAGGLELALSCDLLVAARGVRLGIPETAVGLFAAGGALLRLPARIGYTKAMEMALTAAPMMSEEAFDRGLIVHLTSEGEAVDVALRLAEQTTRNAPLAVAASKKLLRAARESTDDEFWALQMSLRETVFASRDAQEGPKAFAERRPPTWTGT